jgi:hypothetical protein
VTASGANAFASGTIGGTGNFVIGSGSLVWSGGTMTGTGVTRLAQGATLTQSASATLANGRALEFAGLYAQSGDVALFSSGPPGPLVHVTGTGTLRKSAGANTGRIDAALENDGVAESTSGTLRLNGGSGPASSSGRYGGAAGSVELDGGSTCWVTARRCRE